MFISNTIFDERDVISLENVEMLMWQSDENWKWNGKLKWKFLY